jgi:hypothetical protein
MMYVGAKLLARGRPERLLPESPDWAADDRLGSGAVIQQRR